MLIIRLRSSLFLFFNFIILVLIECNESIANLPLSELFREFEESCIAKGRKGCSNTPYDKHKDFIGPKYQKVHLALPRRELKKIGSVEHIDLNGRTMKVKQLSETPHIFEVSNFLSDNETELIIEMAQRKGLKNLHVMTSPVLLPENINQSIFDRWDFNLDGKISAMEFTQTPEVDPLMLSQNDILKMINLTKVDGDKDGFMTLGELRGDGLKRIKEYLIEREAKRSRLKTNGVSESWLWHDDDELLMYENLLEDYHDRIQEITGVPKEVIEQTEPLNVNQMNATSFSPCQYDSNGISKDRKCCVFGGTDCRMCRYLSIFMFLNDVESGGELVFPLAGEASSTAKITKEELISRCEIYPKVNLSNLVIPPERGKAVFWYNHDVSPKTGWMSHLESKSVVGVAPVGNKTQWAGKMWIDIIGDGVDELRTWRLGTNWLSKNNENKEIIKKLRNDFFREDEKYVHKFRKSYHRDGSYAETLENEKAETGQFHINTERATSNAHVETGANDVDVNEEAKKAAQETIRQKSMKETNHQTLVKPNIPGSQTLNLHLNYGHGSEEVPQKLSGHDLFKDGRTISNRFVQASLLLIEELGRDELEIVARNLYEKLQLNCVPLIVNHFG